MAKFMMGRDVENSAFIGIVAESIREVTVAGSDEEIICNLLLASPDLFSQDAWHLRGAVEGRHAFVAGTTIPVVCDPWSGAVW